MSWWSDLSKMRKLSVIYLLLILLIVPVGIYGVYRATSVDSEAAIAPAPQTASDLVKNYPPEQCLITGCSSELCVDSKLGPINTLCVMKEEYLCYQQFGNCEVQADGECGWTVDEKLVACLDQEPISSPSPNILGTPVPQPTITTSSKVIASPSPTPSLVYVPSPSPYPDGLADPNFVPKPSPSPYFLPPVVEVPIPTPDPVPAFRFSLFGRPIVISLPTYLLTLFTNN